MRKRYPLIKTKFVPPVIKDSNVHRPSLIKKLNGVVTVPVTLIHSGPGYGKSTSIASYLEFQTYRYSWYTLSKQEDTFIPFVVHMIYAVQATIPSFGQKLLEYILSEEMENLEEELEFLCSEFINELLLIEETFILVLDDVHFIEGSENSKKWLMILIEYLPKNIHLILSGRIRPTWDILTRLLVRGELLEITEQDLCFTNEEISYLFADFYEIELAEEQIEYVSQLTKGWIIAIQMIWQQLKITGNLELDSYAKLGSHEGLFRYLAMEVFTKQPVEIREFLLATSIFEEFDTAFCNDVFQREDVDSIITYLIDQNMFIILVGDTSYRYHPLFKDFLLRKLRLDEAAHAQHHHRAASYFLLRENYEKAIYHYLELEETSHVGDILATYGQTLLADGKIEPLARMIERLPLIVKNKYKKLWFIEGEINRYFCHYEKALTCYRQLEDLSFEQNDMIAASLAQEGKARIYLDTIQPAKADGYLSQAIQWMEASEEDDERKILLYSLMAENLVNLGKAMEAEQWLEKCRSVKENFSKVELEARYYLRTGKLVEAKNCIEKATSNSHGKQENPLTQSHRETDLILSIICSFIGDLQQGKKLAERAILRGTLRKSPFVEACGWMRMGHVVQLDSRYDERLAFQCYETALLLMEKINMSRGKSEAYMGLTALYGRIGNYAEASRMAMMALEEPTRVKDQWLASFVYLSQGTAAMYCKEYEEAQKYLDLAYKGFIDCGETYGQALASFWLVKCGYDVKNNKLFAGSYHTFIQLVEKYNYHFFVTKKTLFGPKDLQIIIPMLLEAKQQRLNINLTDKIIHLLGYSNLTFHPGYTIQVKTLGDFQVWLGHEKVNEREWKREKAKELFQLFITKRGTMLPKEEILSLVWKDHDYDAAQRDFKVALNALNKVIEPDRKVRTNPFFIQREESYYGMNKEAWIEVDADLFEEWIEQSLRIEEHENRIDILVRALSLYEGDYLPGRLFEDWCMEERERLRSLYLQGAERLAKAYLEVDNLEGVIDWCNKIIEKDVCWEEAYRMLMYCYYRNQNRTMAIRVYEKCEKKLLQELGVRPLQQTRDLLERIKKAATNDAFSY